MSTDQSGGSPADPPGQQPPPEAAPPPGPQDPAAPYGQQGYGQQGYGQQSPGQHHPQAGAPWATPVAKPGVVPLRQLALGDIYGGAFQTIRRNPRASIGLAFVVSAVFMAIPLLGSLFYGAADLGGLDVEDTGLFATGGGVAFTLLSYSGSVLNVLATIVITGLMTRIVGSAVVGRPMRAGEAWTRTKGRLPALVGLSLLALLVTVVLGAVAVGVVAAVGFGTGSVGLTIVVGILVGLGTVALAVFVWTRFLLLATPALVLENVGIATALRRGGQLSRGQFWRLFGIALLAQLIVSVAAQVIAIPLGLAGFVALFVVGGSWGVAVLLLVSNLATLISAALVSPFVAGVTTLQYVDQRFRKEGLDIDLVERALDEPPPRQAW